MRVETTTLIATYTLFYPDRKSTGGSPSSAADTPSSGKKPRRQELKSPQKEKEDARKSSRKRAQQYAQSLAASDLGGASAGTPNGTAEGTSDNDDRNGSNANNNVSDGGDSSDIDVVGGMEPPPSRNGRVTNHAVPSPRVAYHVAPPRRVTPSPRVSNHVAPPRRVTDHVAPSPRLTNRLAPSPRLANHVAPPLRERPAPLETPPPMPQIFPGLSETIPSVPPFVGLPTPTPPKREAGRRPTGLVDDPSPRSSFLRYAGKDEGVAGAEEPSLASTRVTGSRTPATLPAGKADEPAAATPGGRARRQSFLRPKGADGGVPVAKKAVAPAVVSPCKKGEVGGGGDKSTAAAAGAGRRAGRGGPCEGRVGGWASTCMVALVPLVLSCLLWGVVVPVWPLVSLQAGSAWSAMSAIGAESSHEKKCFLTSEQDASICRPGTTVANCPAPAFCDLGRILSCDVPFEKTKDGTACVLSAAMKKEADTVVTALRTLTVEEQCKGSGIILPSASSRRSMITLTEAAASLESKPLSLLAVMPAGDIAGLIDLEGEPAEYFGGGEDGAGGSAGSGSERVARLSASIAGAVSLPWGCRFRAAAGNVVLAHWKILLAFCALCVAIVSYDVRRLLDYRQHVKVCTMRDAAYKALLEHTEEDSSPMQTSHIQDFVGDRRRANGEGSTAKTQSNVRKLWHLVEREVEHDTRIRRSYRNMRGQHNVDCWQWVGPSSATLGTIGVLDPGPAPRLWLLWWFNQPIQKS